MWQRHDKVYEETPVYPRPNMRESPGAVTTIIAVLGLVIAVGGWINGCREIDHQREALAQQEEGLEQQKEALRAEREARKRELRFLERQTQLVGAGLRPVLAPGEPVVRAYEPLPNGAARVAIRLVNQSSSLALQGRLSVTVFLGVLPPLFLFDFYLPVEERARLGGFNTLPARSARVIRAVIPRRVLQAAARGGKEFIFVVRYTDAAQQASQTTWRLDALRPGARARFVTFTTGLR